MTQTELTVETRAEQLERQHQLLKQVRELDEQAVSYKHAIKSIRDEKKSILGELDKLTTILESEQVTLAAK
jgi:molybdopterin biosynthesis enzyme MoaB